ncbi:MAG: rod shape-determining protein MreD, partial [Chloroflexi bacterium]|nr:rod shape-determining protein MreD [Chloroflexota bacterium]
MSLQLGLPLMLVAAMLQAVLLPHLRVLGGQPDLVLVIVLAWSTLDRGSEGMVWAVAGGLLLDMLSGVPLGVSSLAMVPIAFFVSLTEAQVYRTNVFLPLLLTGLGSLAYHLIYLGLLAFLVNQPVAWGDSLSYVTLPSAL